MIIKGKYLTCAFLFIFLKISAHIAFFPVDNFPPDSIKPDSAKIKDTIISKSAIKSTINYFAKDSIPIDIVNNIITLYGDAWITYEDIKLEAAIIKIDWKNELIYAEGVYDKKNKYTGAPKFYDKTQEYKTKKMVYNFRTKKAKIYDLLTKEGEGYIHGSNVKKDSQDNIYASKSKYTTCDLDDPHFYIYSSKVEILKDKIISGPAYLVLEGVPTPLAVPFGFFPKTNKRSSGIVLPTYGESAGRGFFLQGIGYYFGINDYFDLLLKGDIYSRGSWLISAASSYAKRYKYSGNINIVYGYNKFGDPETPEYVLSKDFKINWSHTENQKSHPNSTFSANVNAGSSNSYRNNSYNLDQTMQNALGSSISWSKRFPGTPISLTGSLTHNQNLTNKTIDLDLPRFALNVSRVMPFKNENKVSKKRWYEDIGFTYSLSFENTLNTFDSLLFKKETWDKLNYGFRHDLPVSMNIRVLKYFTFTPSLTYTGRTYFTRMVRIYENDSVIQKKENGFYHLNEYQTAGNLSTRVYGMYNINRLGIIAIRHVMSPSLSFTYKPDFSESQYGIYKQVQVDSTGKTIYYSPYESNKYGSPGNLKTGNIALSLQNNLESKLKTKDDTGSAKTRKVTLIDDFGLQLYYNIFADSMKLSSVRYYIRTALFKNLLNVEFNSTMSPYVMNHDYELINKLQVAENGKLGRITDMTVTLGFNLKSTDLKKKKGENENTEKNKAPQHFPGEESYVDFEIPWNFNLSYTLNYSCFTPSGNKLDTKPQVIQTMNFGGNLSVTKKWKLEFRSGYDIQKGDLTPTSINIIRDLHCWQMSFNFIPFGYWRSYMFTLNVKSDVLKDLKIDKKKNNYDY